MAVPTFVDRVTLRVTGGRGGNGVASVHREKFKPLGGPDGGNGGPGGSVILRVDPDVTTLVDYHHRPTRKAEHGGHGAGVHRNGAHGSDLVLAVPDGSPVLLLTRRSFATGVPVEYVVSAYRADRYQLHVTLDRSAPGVSRPAVSRQGVCP